MSKNNPNDGRGKGEGSKATQFGQPNGNPRGDQRQAEAMRTFLRRLRLMTEEEMKAYAADKSNPYLMRKAVESLAKMSTPKDLFAFINQIEGMPVQPISTEEMPDIHIDLTNESDKG